MKTLLVPETKYVQRFRIAARSEQTYKPKVWQILEQTRSVVLKCTSVYNS